MKIGFLTVCLGQLSLEEIAGFAKQQGFEALEVACWPRTSTRDFFATTIDVVSLTSKEAGRIKKVMNDNGLEISCLTYAENMLHNNVELRQSYARHLTKVIDAAEVLGAGVVSCFVGRNPDITVKENLKEFEKVFSKFVQYARSKKVKVAIENCPMPDWQFEGLVGQIAYSPEIWEKMFQLIPDEHLGLNFDPSHLYWLGIDYNRAVKDFAKRIFHAHAKDAEILPDELYRKGNILAYSGWWRYRMPGQGQINWQSFVSTLRECGYNGVISIEHEDPIWQGSIEKVKEGLSLSRKVLSRVVRA
jgi:sugar phosphate isomerase/epimerase